MRVVYSSRYCVDIGPHVFPTLKYAMVYDRLIEAGLVSSSEVVEPPEASWEQLSLVHTREYLDRMRDGTLSLEEVTELELPWSQEMVDGFRLMVGGTITAAMLAVKRGRGHGRTTMRRYEALNGLSNGAKTPPDPISVHIGGGLHHAFPNHGEGFCPFNDVAVAVRVLQAQGIERLGIVDLDVHHGNGTAFIFNPRGAPPPHGEDRRLERRLSASAEADAGVFTFSMHQQHNYPMWKPRGSLDIGLADGTGDKTFLSALERALPRVMASNPQCVFYLAGADPYEDDQLGGLRLTREGLRQRDRLVIETVRGAAVPLVITLAGGYARRVDDTVAIHVATIEEALATQSRNPEGK
jgi:acetoin utilization deacetylase AcuC-like enzyme